MNKNGSMVNITEPNVKCSLQKIPFPKSQHIPFKYHMKKPTIKKEKLSSSFASTQKRHDFFNEAIKYKLRQTHSAFKNFMIASELPKRPLSQKSHHTQENNHYTKGSHHPTQENHYDDRIIQTEVSPIKQKKKDKRIPISTSNFLCNIRRFDYNIENRKNPELGPGTYFKLKNEEKKDQSHNIAFFFHKRIMNDYEKKKKQSTINKEQPKPIVDEIVKDNLLFIPGKPNEIKKQRKSRSLNVWSYNKLNAQLYEFLTDVNKEIFEVLPTKKIISMFVSKSLKGFPSFNNHIPGPTYYNPIKTRSKSFYKNKQGKWW